MMLVLRIRQKGKMLIISIQQTALTRSELHTWHWADWIGRQIAVLLKS